MHIFRHLAQKLLAWRQPSCVVFVQSDEKSDGAIRHLELCGIASKYGINPNMLRNWKKEFLENAGRVFAESKIEKEARRKEDGLKKDREQMLKTI